MLLQAKVDFVPEEGGRKRNSVWPDSLACGNIVLTLLAKVVAFHVRPTAVDVRVLALSLSPDPPFEF